MKKKDIIVFLSVGVLFGILNALTVSFPILSAIVSIVENVIVISLLVNNKYELGFYFLLLFTSISIEHNVFALGDSLKSSTRFTFIDPPIIHGWLFSALVLYIFIAINSIKILGSDNHDVGVFKKWLKLLLISGVLSIIVGMVIDDNGIISSGYYPQTAITEILAYAVRMLIFWIAFTLVKNEATRKNLSLVCQMVLIIIVISSLMSTFVFGVHGWYADYVIMLTPLAIGLTPCLMAFFSKDNNYKTLSLVLSILIILATFLYPTCIGSKWYLIIFLSVIGWIIRFSGFKSIGLGLLITVGVLILVVNNAEYLLSFVDDEYAVWKLTQALNLLSVIDIDFKEAFDLYDVLDHSTIYRFDELHNTFLEFCNKPLFAPFGKGIAGTTLHYTDVVDWSSDTGAFSEMQNKMKAYYNMHESFAIIFLRHGITGVLFIFYAIVKLVKKIPLTPWAIPALVWFLFNWAYGQSFIIGSVMMVLAFADTSQSSNLLKKQSKKNEKVIDNSARFISIEWC